MRDNSLDIATMVAYTEAGKSITIKEKKNVVIARTKDNGLEVGDIILSADNTTCEDVNDIKKIIICQSFSFVSHSPPIFFAISSGTSISPNFQNNG